VFGSFKCTQWVAACKYEVRAFTSKLLTACHRFIFLLFFVEEKDNQKIQIHVVKLLLRHFLTYRSKTTHWDEKNEKEDNKEKQKET
jgi:hypothetical protein